MSNKHENVTEIERNVDTAVVPPITDPSHVIPQEVVVVDVSVDSAEFVERQTTDVEAIHVILELEAVYSL